jgi:hypothetical protein
VYAGASELFDQENYLPAYGQAVAQMITEQTQNCTKVLEFGAGVGTLALHHERIHRIKPDCLEIDPQLIQVLTKRTQLDRAVGHFRRYDKAEIKSKLELAGYKVTHFEFCDSLGFLVWWLNGFKKLDTHQKIGSPKMLKLYDQVIFPLSLLLDKLGCRYLFGKNLLIVAQSKPL